MNLSTKLTSLPVVGGLFTVVRPPVIKALLRVRGHFWTPEREWEQRTRAVLNCRDNALIPRVANAGRIENGQQIMHNGIHIVEGSYYGELMARLLERTGGVHEPQEERVFAEVLLYLPERATMLELGAYWSFYSMWFHHAVQRPTCYMVEPEEKCLELGRSNFALNKMQGTFERAFVSSRTGKMDDGVNIISVDDFMERHEIEHLHLLHSDIQGHEGDMLRGAQRALDRGAIDFIFISTHSQEVHQECRQMLLERKFDLIAEADLLESFSVDGILVAVRSDVKAPAPIKIHRRGE